VVLFIGALAFVPRQRSLASVCALAGAATIAVQLPATHWYYYYIMWFVPFALVAFVAAPAPVAETADERVVDDGSLRSRQGEPALAGV